MPEAVHKTVLGNGVRVVSRRMPRVHSVSMGIWVNVGARDESPAQNGISHFIEHMIFKGTQRRSAYQIAKEFDAIGGNSNAFTSMENTCYHAKVLDTHVTTMVDILSDIFLNSVFDPLEIERERPVIFQEIGMVEDSPEDLVHLLAGRTFWGENPLGRSILGSKENIAGFDSRTILAFFTQCYQPDRIIIAAAGNIHHQQLLDLVGPAFESLPTGRPLPERETPLKKGLLESHYRKLEQLHICLGTKGLCITDPDRYAFSLLNVLLGGNMSSRLFQRIRERQGLAYSVYSFTNSFEDTGMFGVYTAVEAKNAVESLRIILEEMRQFKTAAVSDQELRDAKEYTKGSLLLATESTENQMVRLAQNEYHFGRFVPLKEIIDQVDAVRPQDLLQMANVLFQTANLALTTLGPLRRDADIRSLMEL